MKSIKLVLMLTVAGLCTVSCKNTAEKTTAIKTDAVKTESVAQAGKMETASFDISGMSCQVMCAAKIEKELAAMDGVTKATVNFDKKTATIKYDSAKQSPEKLVEKVESVADGKTYKVSNLKSSANKAMVYGDPVKEKNAADRKAKRAAKKAGTTAVPTKEKAGCCASKKQCGSGEKASTL